MNHYHSKIKTSKMSTINLEQKIKKFLGSPRKYFPSSSFLPIALLSAIFFLLSSFYNKETLAQEKKPEHKTTSTSMWGPQRPWEYEGIFSYTNNPEFSEYSLVGWGGNHRGKGFAGSLSRKIESDVRSDELNLGVRQFPLVYIPGTSETLADLLETKGALRIQNDKNSSETDWAIYLTLRTFPFDRYVKAYYGHEIVDKSTGDNQRSDFLSVRTNINSFLDVLAVTSNVEEDNKQRTHLGGGMLFYFPGNFYTSLNLTRNSDKDQGDMTTISVGRYADYFGENFPTFFFTYRGDNQKGIYLGGLMIGGKQQFVKPAAVGIAEGFFSSSAALPDLKTLRRFEEFGVFSNDYEIAALVAFYTKFKTKIPGTGLNAGAEELDIYWTPLEEFLGLHLDFALVEETSPNFREMKDDKKQYYIIGLGLWPHKNIEVLGSYTPKKQEISAAVHAKF